MRDIRTIGDGGKNWGDQNGYSWKVGRNVPHPQFRRYWYELAYASRWLN